MEVGRLKEGAGGSGLGLGSGLGPDSGRVEVEVGVCLECGNETETRNLKEGLCEECCRFLGENDEVSLRLGLDLEEEGTDLEIEAGIPPADLPFGMKPAEYAKFLKWQEAQRDRDLRGQDSRERVVTLVQSVLHKYSCELCEATWEETVQVKHTAAYKFQNETYSLDLVAPTCRSCEENLLRLDKKDLVALMVNHVKTLNQRWMLRRR